MRSLRVFATLLFLATLAFSQAAPSTTSAPSAATPQATPAPPTQEAAPAQKDESKAPPAKAPVEVPPTAPVIIIKGGCADAPATTKPANCKKQVTRAEFEKLIDALNPEMPPNVRQSFAQNYGKLLVIANEAHKRGIQNDPNIQIMMEFAKLQVLAQELGKRLQKEANNVPPAAVEAYYKEHQRDFETADLKRIIVPKPTASAEKPVDEQAEKAYAEKIRERWAAGEDPAKLQAEAYEHAGNKVQPPAVDLGNRRRGAVQVELPVFDFKPGELSQPISNQSAFFIYQLVKKETVPLEKAQEDIKKTLAGQRLQAEMDQVTNSGAASLNESYFGTGAAPATSTAPGKPSPTSKAKPAATSKPAGAKPKTAN